MAQGYNPYYGGPTNRQEAPLGLLEYQRMITQGDPNSPLYNAPQFTPRTGGDLRGVQSFGTIQQPEEQNVGTVASQIDANLSALEGADKARKLYEDTTFGFNAQQGEWPGTVFKDVGDFGSDVMTGGENVGEFIGSQFTGKEPSYGLLSNDLMKDMSNVPGELPSGSLLPANINPKTGFPDTSQIYNIGKGYSPTIGAATGGHISGTSAGGSIGQNLGSMIQPSELSQAQQIFSPNYVDPNVGALPWDASYNSATNSMQAIARPAAATNVSNLTASAAEAVPDISALTNWNQTGTPLVEGGLEGLQASLEAPSLMNPPDVITGATEGAEALKSLDVPGAEGAGWGGKVLPGIGAGLSIYDMIEGGVNPGNVMGLGSAAAFLAPAAMGLGPLGWALAGGSLLGSLFDWW